MFLMSLILSVTVAHADAESDKFACQNTALQRDSYVSAAVKKQNLDLCLASKKNSQTAATLRSSLDILKDKEATCFKDDRGFFGRVFNKNQRSPTSADVARCDKERADKEAQLASLDASLKEQDKQVRVAEASYNAQKDTAQATAEQRAKTNDIVEDEFNTIKMSIFDSKLQAADAALRLTKMATALDNSAMGLYLRERMAGLLNSDAMCSAVKECPKPSNIKGSDLNSIFNSTMNTGVNSEYEATSAAPAGKVVPKAGTAK